MKNTLSQTKAPKKSCSKCFKEKRLKDDFYISYSPLHSDGRLPVCKQCLKQMVDPNDISSVKDMLRQIDRPYVHSMWITASQETEKLESIFGKYLKNISMNKLKEYTWADSEFEEEGSSTHHVHDEVIQSDINSKSRDKFILTDKIIDKWGDGYSPDEYRQFERKYSRLINNYGEKTALHTEGLITYIRYRVKEEMATARGDVKEAKEWGTLASKAAQDAKINVSQLSKSDISGGVDVLSQLFEAVESEVGVIPLLPHLLEQPYDDADMVIWATVNYNRRLEDKPSVPYRDIWNFYDEMLEEHFKQQGYNDQQITLFKTKRNNVFRDLSHIYIEPLYEGDGD